jgi:hypothetical protein
LYGLDLARQDAVVEVVNVDQLLQEPQEDLVFNVHVSSRESQIEP